VTVDENYILAKQCAVKPVIKTDTLTGGDFVTKTVNRSRQYCLQHCDKLK